ncbi:MAG: glycosyltransferase [Propionibacteriaceae bacterium]|nr:glycosyltransferase [Propionibacteriaceae bacterium]
MAEVIAALAVLCQVILIIAAGYGLYHGVLALPVVGTLAPLVAVTDRSHRFAVLVFAKDEAAVIGQLLESLRQQDYPAEDFEIFVTADNCTDDTAGVARAAGATVGERFDTSLIGKGHALTWFFDRFDRAAEFDACVIFDADNLVDPGVLAAMNRQLNAGNPIAAGYRVGKNPGSTWVSGCSSLFWLMQTRLFHLPRARHGLPVTSVGGTGFMFDLAVLNGRGWHTSSACEDIEFTLHAIAEGHHVGLALDAVFYDEQPLTFAQSLRQRYRWAVGSVQVIGLCGRSLWQAARADWRGKLDAFLFSIGIPIAGATGLAWVGSLLTRAADSGDWLGLVWNVAFAAGLGYLLITAIALLVLRLEKATWPGIWLTVATFPVYLLSWSILNIVVLFYRDPTWVPIPHTEALALDEVRTTPTITPIPAESEA